MQNTGSPLPWYLGTFADALLRNGKNAQPVLQEAFDQLQATEEHWYEAELYRLRGDLALSGSFRGHDRAEEDYWKAISIAKGQGARLFELRATCSLAELWRSQGRNTEARDVLAAIFAWFTEGFDGPDLKRAKARLAQLDG